MSPEDPRVTVVVASQNRRDELLASLARHHAPVVYVDNASTDGSAAAVRERFPRVEVVRLRRNAGAYARTVGARRARTPFLAFADDDSWWAPGALAAGAATLACHPRLGLLNARILVGPEARTDPACEEMARSPLPRGADVPGVPILGFVACGAMVRRDAFLAADGFDPVVRFPGEEERLAIDLAAAGWAMSYVDDVVVHHHPSPVRHSPARRVRAITRASLLTGVMRLAWPDAAARFRRAWQAGPAQRSGAVDALRDLPVALSARRPAPAEVLRQLELLSRTPAERMDDQAAGRRVPAGARSYGGDA